jgi:xylose isomerase
MLREKARQWHADGAIAALLAEINADDGAMAPYQGAYSAEKAAALKDATFDRQALGARGLAYERLDQLTVDLLLGLR